MDPLKVIIDPEFHQRFKGKDSDNPFKLWPGLANMMLRNSIPLLLDKVVFVSIINIREMSFWLGYAT